MKSIVCVRKAVLPMIRFLSVVLKGFPIRSLSKGRLCTGAYAACAIPFQGPTVSSS